MKLKAMLKDLVFYGNHPAFSADMSHFERDAFKRPDGKYEVCISLAWLPNSAHMDVYVESRRDIETRFAKEQEAKS